MQRCHPFFTWTWRACTQRQHGWPAAGSVLLPQPLSSSGMITVPPQGKGRWRGPPSRQQRCSHNLPLLAGTWPSSGMAAAACPLSTFGSRSGCLGVRRKQGPAPLQGLPARAEFHRLLGSVSAVVDRAMTPAHHAGGGPTHAAARRPERPPPRPASGAWGFRPPPGPPPRQAVMAVRCVQRVAGLLLLDPPWMGVVLRLLRRCNPAAHPVYLLAQYNDRVLGLAPPADFPTFVGSWALSLCCYCPCSSRGPAPITGLRPHHGDPPPSRGPGASP